VERPGLAAASPTAGASISRDLTPLVGEQHGRMWRSRFEASQTPLEHVDLCRPSWQVGQIRCREARRKRYRAPRSAL
jgi:hypothetical protein